MTARSAPRVARRLVAAAIGCGLATASCTLFESDIPDKSCKSNEDCFQAQGERCVSMECVAAPAIDAAPDAAIAIDSAVDATVAP